MTIETLGKRLARFRKTAGFRTPADLAKATRTGWVTTATIQNLESGRKAEITLTQLVDLSRTVGFAPACLMADARRPLGESPISGFTNWELVRSLGIPVLADDAPDADERRVIQHVRSLMSIREEWADALLEVRRTANPPRPDEVVFGEFDVPSWGADPHADAVFVVGAMRRAAESAREDLVALGVTDLDWADGPWFSEAGAS